MNQLEQENQKKLSVHYSGWSWHSNILFKKENKPQNE